VAEFQKFNWFQHLTNQRFNETSFLQGFFDDSVYEQTSDLKIRAKWSASFVVKIKWKKYKKPHENQGFSSKKLFLQRNHLETFLYDFIFHNFSYVMHEPLFVASSIFCALPRGTRQCVVAPRQPWSVGKLWERHVGERWIRKILLREKWPHIDVRNKEWLWSHEVSFWKVLVSGGEKWK